MNKFLNKKFVNGAVKINKMKVGPWQNINNLPAPAI